MTNKELLSSLLKAARSGQIEIRSILDTTMEPSLRAVLVSQLQEYDAIETEALTIALQRGWEMPDLYPGVRFLKDRAARFRVKNRSTDSTIADIMILHNTKSMIDGIKKLHQLHEKDSPIQILSQKLLDCENANIRRLQMYL
jgi:hypothetical protein